MDEDTSRFAWCAQGTMRGFQSSLRDFNCECDVIPPINRWAILATSLRDFDPKCDTSPPINRWAIFNWSLWDQCNSRRRTHSVIETKRWVWSLRDPGPPLWSC